MKYVSMKGLADFIAAGPSKQRTLVRQYKYPRDDEARAKIIYYREARDLVEAFHRGDRDPGWLEDQSTRLESVAAGLTGRTRTRLRHNARGVRQYVTHFGEWNLTPLEEVKFRIDIGDVRVSIAPDLHVVNSGREQFLKLEFGVDPPEGDEVRVICQLFYEATCQAGLQIPARDVLYLDVPRGEVHRGARVGARMLRTIEDACQTYSAIWDQL